MGFVESMKWKIGVLASTPFLTYNAPPAYSTSLCGLLVLGGGETWFFLLNKRTKFPRKSRNDVTNLVLFVNERTKFMTSLCCSHESE